VIPRSLWDTTIPTAFVTCVIAATELCRVPMTEGSGIVDKSAVCYTEVSSSAQITFPAPSGEK
jgi:hypothetical protein